MQRDRLHREPTEDDARQSLVQCYGRPLSDEEWAAAKDALLKLGRLLRDWSKQAEERAA